MTWRTLKWTTGLLLFLLLVQRCTYPMSDARNLIAVLSDDHHFDYIQWEINAIATKVGQTLWGVHPFMEEADRSQYVRDYMADLAAVRQLEAQIDAVYTDPNISDPDAATADQRAERDARRADLNSRQALAEAILEGQVASVLIDAGFGTLGQLLPPMSMHFTQVPNLLITSQRDEISFDTSINLDPMPIDDIAALEQQIETEADVSALIVPLGGIALYPAMILETTNLAWAVETFAHEWLHHYLFFFPLGLNYFTGDNFAGEARIINETTADIFGEEIGREVLARYYPDLLVDSAPQTAAAVTDASQFMAEYIDSGTFASDILAFAPLFPAQTDDQPFDFGAAMHETRTTVDDYMRAIRLLQRKADLVEAAESTEAAELYHAFANALVQQVEIYMEQRRQVFFDNGYRIRRLNQAYFAFYGGYQGGIAGIGGEDPIGPAVRDIRAASADVHEFIVTLRGITTREELLNVRDALVAAQEQGG